MVAKPDKAIDARHGCVGDLLAVMTNFSSAIQAYLEPGNQNLDLKKDGATLLGLYPDTVLL